MFSATLKKQSTVRDKVENGVSETVEENLVKPSAAKLADKSRVGEERTSKFAKSALKSIDKIPKLEDKLGLNDKKDTSSTNSTNNKNSEKVPEKPTLRSVRTIDADKGKEKSVTIVDKKTTEKNGTTPTSKAVNDKPLNKINANEKSVIKTNTIANEKPSVKANEKPLSKNNTLTNETSLNKKINTVEKPLNKTTTNDKTVKNNTVIEKPNNKTINDKVPKTTVNDKSPNDKFLNNSASKDSKVDVKPNLKTTEKVKVEPKTEAKLEDKKEKTEMATKPPLEKGPSKVSANVVDDKVLYIL